MRALILAFSFAAMLGSTIALAREGSPYWQIRKTAWSQADERAFSQFVTSIGRSGCRTFDSCLKGAGNPYRGTDPAGTKYFSDCADLPYMLRGYFAWKNGLPFSVVMRVTAIDPSTRDVRYSPGGNAPTARMDIISLEGPRFPIALPTLRTTVDNIHSGMFRFPPQLRVESDVYNGVRLARHAPDFYSVAITRESIRPGTVIYDPNGHVAVVYAIEDDGRVLYMDSHPDNSLTRGVYGRKFARSSPGSGAGFKNFRPQVLVNAYRDNRGNYIGGVVLLKTDEALPDHDLTQFFGTRRGSSWSRGVFEHQGREVDYYDWVRLKLAKGALRFHPVLETRNMLDSLCNDVKDRVHSVEKAVADGVHRRSIPDRLPENIFGATGDWETYASPSRDARLRTAFVELKNSLQSMMERHRAGDSSIDYRGTNLKKDLLKTYDEVTRACVISYRRTDGRAVKLNLEDIRERLYAMSFDPHHCPELRWGAAAADELSSCGDGGTKRAWYRAEQRLRNQIERTYDVEMGFTLRELESGARGTGTESAPDVNIGRLLR